MTTTTREPGAGGPADTDVPAWGEPLEQFVWGRCASDDGADYWSRVEGDEPAARRLSGLLGDAIDWLAVAPGDDAAALAPASGAGVVGCATASGAAASGATADGAPAGAVVRCAAVSGLGAGGAAVIGLGAGGAAVSGGAVSAAEVSGATGHDAARATNAAPAGVAGAELFSVGEQLLAELEAIQQQLASVAGRLGGVFAPELAGLAARATAVVAVAEAARAAIVLDADARGVIASTDNPRVDRFVEQACRDAGVPVTNRHAHTLKDVAAACEGHDVSTLRAAVVTGRVTLESAAIAARFYRRIRQAVVPGNWEPVLESVIDAVAAGAGARDLDAMAEMIIAQYGAPGDLDREHEADYVRRSMSTFRRDSRTGMMTATVRLDPASEAVVTAAITALSTPQPVDDAECGTVEPDERTPDQRRADALIALAGVATRHHGELPLTGAKAKVVVTISHDSLAASLDEVGSHGVGVTEHGQVLTASEVRMLACDAGIIPVVLGTESEPLDVGREKRLVQPGQRVALNERDGGCSFPGCTAPPSWCDAHHLIEWIRGGPTDLPNLALLCRHHHREVHSKGHLGTATRSGVTWTRADGTSIGNTPRAERCR